MSSILTNNGAMVALQTLQSINKNLGMTQSEISTGKSVASAKDNSAVWAISKQMDSDVKGFKAIGESLNLGESTVAVARNAAESITDLLTEMKGKIVAAQEENVDRGKIQTDIDALEEQIGSIVSAAQFNGLNLIDGNSSDAMNVLSSLNRDSNGVTTSDSISVSRQNLSVTTPTSAQDVSGKVLFANDAAAAAVFAGSAGVTENGTNAGTVNAVTAGNSFTATVASATEGNIYSITLGAMEITSADGGTATASRTFDYVASGSDGNDDIARALMAQINAFTNAADGSAGGYTAAISPTDSNQLVISNGAGNNDLEVTLSAGTGGVSGSTAATGGLGGVSTIDVENDAIGALGLIDTLINKSIDAAAAFGSAQGRIETQSDFISKLSDSLTSGIGALVDANMEEASARLQALQVQQQLATQSLSIANQAPQSILSLFR